MTPPKYLNYFAISNNGSKISISQFKKIKLSRSNFHYNPPIMANYIYSQKEGNVVDLNV